MKNNNIIKKTLLNFKENELIFANTLYKTQLYNYVNEAAFYKTLERMCKSGELVKIAKGTYHVPKVSKYGIVPPTDKEIIKSFTKNNTGTVVGYSLYNALNLTTQVAKSIEVMSATIESFSKTIRNVIVHKVHIDYNENEYLNLGASYEDTNQDLRAEIDILNVEEPENKQEYVGEEENNSQEQTTENKDEKAIQAVKKEWGEDTSVTFSIEQKKGNIYYLHIGYRNDNKTNTGQDKFTVNELRAFCKTNGIHIYCETDDIVYVNENYLCIYAVTGGEKTVDLGKERNVTELLEGTYQSRTDTVTVDMEKGETRIFRLG